MRDERIFREPPGVVVFAQLFGVPDLELPAE
jgi:hypothetical protein